MVTRQDIVSAARECLGTPFRHQGRRVSSGLDCAGVVIYVAHRLGISDFDTREYGRLPHEDKLKRHLTAHMDVVPNGSWREGDVLLLAFEREPQHLAIASDIGMIHSYSLIGRCVEHRMDDKWKARIRGAFRFRGVEQ